MKKLFMLVGAMILLMVISSISGCIPPADEIFREGIFHWRYDSRQGLDELASYEYVDDFFIDEVQIEVKNITKEEYDASNYKNVIKHAEKEEYHSIIIKFKYSKETELTQYDMYDISSQVTTYGDPNAYPILISFDNDKYNIKGDVKFTLTPNNEIKETLSLDCNNESYSFDTERPLTVNGVIRRFNPKIEYFSWYLEKDEPVIDYCFVFSEYAYILDLRKEDYFHYLTEDLIIDEVYVSLKVISNEEYLESNFVNVIMSDTYSGNPKTVRITLKIKFTCENAAKEYDVIFLPEEEQYHDGTFTVLVKLINEDLNLNEELKFNLSAEAYPTFTYNNPIREYTINGITYYDYGYNLSFFLERTGERLWKN